MQRNMEWMKRWQGIFVAIVFVLNSTGAIAEDVKIPAIFGITLLQPISLSECPAKQEVVDKLRASYEKSGKPPTWFPYEPPLMEPCYKRDAAKAITKADLADELLWIAFPADKHPEAVKSDAVSATIIDGKVQSITFQTYGYSVQSVILEQLIAKFGQPTTLQSIKKQNGYGASINSSTAGWSLGSDVIALFEGIMSRLDTGFFQIETQAARDRTQALRKKYSGSGTSM